MNRPTPIDSGVATAVARPEEKAASAARLSRLVLTIFANLRPGTRLSKTMLRDLFEAEFCAPEGPQNWTWRLVQDCAEAAIARHAATHPCRGLGEARALDACLPAASHRSEHQVLFQQFSTPPSVAFLVARAAALSQQHSVLEPSAGTGLLAAFAKPFGGHVVANELDPVRADLTATALNLSVSRHDGIQIANLIAHPFARALLNPPFRTSATRRAKREEWAAHLTAAASALRPGGRLVALLPAKAFADGARNARLPKGTTLRAAIGLPCDAFRPSGTTQPSSAHE